MRLTQLAKSATPWIACTKMFPDMHSFRQFRCAFTKMERSRVKEVNGFFWFNMPTTSMPRKAAMPHRRRHRTLYLICLLLLAQAAAIAAPKVRLMIEQSGDASLAGVLALSPDHALAARGTRLGTVTVWSAAAARQWQRFTTGQAPVKALRFSSDSRRLAAAVEDGAIHIWDMQAMQAPCRITPADPERRLWSATSVAWRDQQYVYAAFFDGRIALIDAAACRITREAVLPSPIAMLDWQRGQLAVAASQGLYIVPDNLDVAKARRIAEGEMRAGGWINNGRQLWGHDGADHLRVFASDSGAMLADMPVSATQLVGAAGHWLAWDPNQITPIIFAANRLQALAERKPTDQPWGDASLDSLAVTPDGKSWAIAGPFGVTWRDWHSNQAQAAASASIRTEPMQYAALAANNALLYTASDDWLYIWSLESGRVADYVRLGGRLRGLQADAAGRVWLAQEAHGNEILLRRIDPAARTETVARFGRDFIGFALTPQGAAVLAGKSVHLLDENLQTVAMHALAGFKSLRGLTVRAERILLWGEDAANYDAIEVRRLQDWALLSRKAGLIGVHGAALSPDGRALLHETVDTITLRSADKIEQALWQRPMQLARWPTVLGFESGDVALAASERGEVLRLDGASGKTLGQYRVSSDSTVVSLSLAQDLVLAVDRSGATHIWRAAKQDALATLYALGVVDGDAGCRGRLFCPGSAEWIATDAEHRFDLSGFRATTSLIWYLPQAPMRALSSEAFVRDYFHPGLLAHKLTGKPLPPVAALEKLQLATPQVRIVSIDAVAGQPGRSKVTLEVDPKGAGMQRLNLQRDGVLVASWPGDGAALAIAPGKTARQTFQAEVSLPVRSLRLLDPVTFRAFAYAANGLQGAAATQQVDVSNIQQVLEPSRVYLITMGINRHTNSAFDLSYAVNDAAETGKALGTRLQGVQRQVIWIPLVSDQKFDWGKKSQLEAVLAKLAGLAHDAKQLADIPNTGKLLPATADDLVVFSFAGHGFAEGNDFYLLPSDIPGITRGLSKTALRSAISSTELASWLRPIDAGQMLLVLDACQSAAVVGGQADTLGLTNSRGFGQLAYEKGVLLLAGTQSDDVALEESNLRHGVLSYALVVEGLNRGSADFLPADGSIDAREWLQWGLWRTPDLARAILRGTLQQELKSRNVAIVRSAGDAQRERVQQPVLYDFRGTPRKLPLH